VRELQGEPLQLVSEPDPAALPVRRWREVHTDALHGVVLEVDATEHPNMLAVLQAALHELPPGHRLGYGWDLASVGLGAWVGDRHLRLRIWPVIADETGEVQADDPDHPDADLLVIDLDPGTDAEAIAAIGRVGRILVAGPEAGPTPLVLDIDFDHWLDVAAEVTG
jgi:hypothetical protein